MYVLKVLFRMLRRRKRRQQLIEQRSLPLSGLSRVHIVALLMSRP